MEIGEEVEDDNSEYRYEKERIEKTWEVGNKGIMCRKKNIENSRLL